MPDVEALEVVMDAVRGNDDQWERALTIFYQLTDQTLALPRRQWVRWALCWQRRRGRQQLKGKWQRECLLN